MCYYTILQFFVVFILTTGFMGFILFPMQFVYAIVLTVFLVDEVLMVFPLYNDPSCVFLFVLNHIHFLYVLYDAL